MGEPGEWYTRVPVPVVLILGPLAGLLFFFTLPLSGMLVLAPMAAGKLRTAFSSGGLSPAHVAGHGQPGVSYLEPRLRSGASRRTVEPGDGDTGKLLDLADKINGKNR